MSFDQTRPVAPETTPAVTTGFRNEAYVAPQEDRTISRDAAHDNRITKIDAASGWVTEFKYDDQTNQLSGYSIRDGSGRVVERAQKDGAGWKIEHRDKDGNYHTVTNVKIQRVEVTSDGHINRFSDKGLNHRVDTSTNKRERLDASGNVLARWDPEIAWGKPQKAASTTPPASPAESFVSNFKLPDLEIDDSREPGKPPTDSDKKPPTTPPLRPEVPPPGTTPETGTTPQPRPDTTPPRQPDSGTAPPRQPDSGTASPRLPDIAPPRQPVGGSPSPRLPDIAPPRQPDVRTPSPRLPDITPPRQPDSTLPPRRPDGPPPRQPDTDAPPDRPAPPRPQPPRDKPLSPSEGAEYKPDLPLGRVQEFRATGNAERDGAALARELESLPPGTTLKLPPGLFHLPPGDISIHGRPGAPIRVIGSGDGTVITGGTAESGRDGDQTAYTMRLANPKHFTLENIRFEGSKGYTVWAVNAEDAGIYNCTFSNAGRGRDTTPIHFGGNNADVRIIHNKVDVVQTRKHGHGIYIGEGSTRNLEIRANQIHHYGTGCSAMLQFNAHGAGEHGGKIVVADNAFIAEPYTDPQRQQRVDTQRDWGGGGIALAGVVGAEIHNNRFDLDGRAAFIESWGAGGSARFTANEFNYLQPKTNERPPIVISAPTSILLERNRQNRNVPVLMNRRINS